MKNKKIFCIIFIVIILIVLSILIIFKIKSKDDQQEENNKDLNENPYTTIDKNDIAYNENTGVNELKEETGATGNEDIYQVEEEYDGRKILTIKPSIQYKVAFAGMIKGEKPEFSEIDKIYEENLVNNNGIFVKKDSQDIFINLLKSCTNSEYYFDENNMLKIKNQNTPNQNDNILNSKINGDNQYCVDISGTCYIVDQISGQIQNYDFELMDNYQPYQYYKDNNKYLIFITENKNKKLENNELIQDFIDLIEEI